MAKKRNSCSLILVLFVVGLIAVGLVFRLTEGRRGLKHALNIDSIPSSAKIVKHGGESWTDYLFIAELSIAEEDLDQLLSGRNFEEVEWSPDTFETSWLSKFVPMRVDRELTSLITSPEGFSARCTVFVNPDTTRIVVRYISG